MDGFLVQQPFADLLASGKKTWELRTQPVYLPTRNQFFILATSRPHPIAAGYDRARLGVAVGLARYEGLEGPFTVEELAAYHDRHHVSQEALGAYAKGRRLFAMKITAEPIEPRPYRPKMGAVTILANVEFV
jgi:uncharacterized protein